MTNGSARGHTLTDWLRTRAGTDLLRFLTCGSVDDGKSTLIGRLLYDSHAVFVDQLAGVEADSRRWGTRDGAIDLALLVDGLAAEREQGITIDVAHRYFATPRRNFIVADTPGHEQYTRNMATGASTADAAVLLVDARKGVLTQTRRHSHIVAMLGIRHVALAVNKMDLLGFARHRFEEIDREYRAFAVRLGLTRVAAIPVSAQDGDNVVHRGARTPWYDGPTLMEWLERLDVEEMRLQRRPFRMPIQLVTRPSPDFRGFAGTVVSGRVRVGDAVRVSPGGRASTIARIVAFDGDLDVAVAGQPVTLTLADEVDVSRGDLIGAAGDSPEAADHLRAKVVWMHEEPLRIGRDYLLKLATQTVPARVTALHKLHPDTLERVAGSQLDLNEIGVCDVALDRAVWSESYGLSRELGGFILIDRTSHATVGAGMVESPLAPRTANVFPQAFAIDKAARGKAKAQRPCAVWLTGRPSAGKSTIADLVEKKLHAMGKHTYVLDGDNLRRGLCTDLGFTAADRAENVRRAAEVAKILVDAGLIVLAAFVSPFAAERRAARQSFADGEFLEIFVDAPLAVAEERDTKGLYAKARRGELPSFTGIDQPYEPPADPDLRIDAAASSADEAADRIVNLLAARGRL